jgi:flavoprotein
MAFWFLRGLRRGVVTTRYPASPEPSTVWLPTPPAFVSSRLTRTLADRVADVCPSGALRRDGNDLVFDLGRCTACGYCLDAAPGVARRSGEFELAALQRRDLLKRIPIGGGPP